MQTKIITEFQELLDQQKEYKPRFLRWAKSYENEVELMRDLILSEPADIKLLKQEYYELTGKQFRRKKGE